MNIETACTLLGVKMVADRAEMLRNAHSAFRKASRHVHPDRVAQNQGSDADAIQERFASLSEALQVVKKVFGTAQKPVLPGRGIPYKAYICIAKLGLREEEMAPSPVARSFRVVYADVCTYCGCTGRYRMENTTCLSCQGVGVLRVDAVYSEGSTPLCAVCSGTGNQFCELPCPRCDGTKKVGVDLLVDIPAGVPLSHGQRVCEIPAAKGSFYSKVIVRVELKQPPPQEPTAAETQDPSDTAGSK